MKFWKWVTNKKGDGSSKGGSDGGTNGTDSRTLYLDGVIADESWFGDEVTPKIFKAELNGGTGDITVFINSPGGDVFAAAQIYTMLREYAASDKGRVIVKIDGLAASAASVISMAGDEVLMSPVSMLMIHNPSTIAIGDSDEMLRAKALLDEIKESIINAYETKTGLSRAKLDHMMTAETWMNANKAVELGFADRVLYAEGDESNAENANADKKVMLFSRAAVVNSILGKLPPKVVAFEKEQGTSAESLYKRLSLLSH